jgi:hypothetical protein
MIFSRAVGLQMDGFDETHICFNKTASAVSIYQVIQVPSSMGFVFACPPRSFPMTGLLMMDSIYL